MALTKTALVETDITTAWGLAEIFDKATDVVIRRFKITAAEADAVHAGDMPPGFTSEDHATKYYVVSSRPLVKHQVIADADGSLWVNLGIVETENNVDVVLVQVNSLNWKKTVDGIEIEQAYLDALGDSIPLESK